MVCDPEANIMMLPVVTLIIEYSLPALLTAVGKDAVMNGTITSTVVSDNDNVVDEEIIR